MADAPQIKISCSLYKIKTGSRALSIADPALWNALPMSIRNAQTVLAFRKLLKSHLFGVWLSRPSSSVAQHPVDVPALSWIMTHDHAKDLCASALGSLGRYRFFI